MFSIDGDVDEVGRRSAEQLMSDDVIRAVSYAAETASTSSAALADLHSGALSAPQVPKLYLTDRQTAGRGRHGRKWIGTAGSLTFSLVAGRPHRHDRSAKLVSLAVAVGVARSLEFEFAPLKTRLKWPNDVHLADGKVAGILLEAIPAAPDRLVIGVGINVNDAPDLVPRPDADAGPEGHAEHRACSLAEVVGRQVHRYQLLPSVVANILGAIAEVDRFADDLLAEFRSRCLLTGQVVRFRDARRSCEGLCRGVADDGELMVETVDGTRRLASGEADLIRLRR